MRHTRMPDSIAKSAYGPLRATLTPIHRYPSGRRKGCIAHPSAHRKGLHLTQPESKGCLAHPNASQRVPRTTKKRDAALARLPPEGPLPPDAAAAAPRHRRHAHYWARRPVSLGAGASDARPRRRRPPLPRAEDDGRRRRRLRADTALRLRARPPTRQKANDSVTVAARHQEPDVPVRGAADAGRVRRLPRARGAARRRGVFAIRGPPRIAAATEQYTTNWPVIII